MISVQSTMPAAARERQPRGVMAIDAARMASGMPGAMQQEEPTTVGGRTSGSVRTTSSTPLTTRGAQATTLARNMPRKYTIAVEIAAILTELYSGYQSVRPSIQAEGWDKRDG